MKNEKFILSVSKDSYKNAIDGFLFFYGVNPDSVDFMILQEIVKKFSKFPYENISKIIKNKRSKGIDKLRLPDEVFEENREYSFGGTCFSLTFYLKKILDSAGFYSYPVLADMRWGRNVHCSLIVLLNGVKYLVDPGYLITTPMEINPFKSKVYKTEFSAVELVFRRESRRYDLYTFDSALKKWRYSFKDKPVSESEFIKAWLDSFNWKTMKGICLNKVEKNNRIYIHNAFMREESFNKKKNFKIKKNLHQTIYNIFGIETCFVEEAMEHVKEIRENKNSNISGKLVINEN